MCMVDAAATSAGAAAEEKAAALAQPAAQEKDAKVKPAAQEKDAPALREAAAQASSVGVTANTTNLQVKCGEKLTAIFSTLCCGTVEMWDAVSILISWANRRIVPLQMSACVPCHRHC